MTKAHFQVITVFPEMIESLFSQGVVAQARKKDLLQISTHSPRQFTNDVHRTVDDRPFGGGDGMVLLCEPLVAAIQAAKMTDPEAQVIYLTPTGKTLTDSLAKELSEKPNLILICGRYGGIDQRVINQYVDQEISIGDYVISGGELAAGVLIDSVARQIPGVLGHVDSAQKESFRTGVLEAPMYTRPHQNDLGQVPEILTSGHHQKIEEWRLNVSRLITCMKRPDLFADLRLSEEEQKQLLKFWQNLSDSDRKTLGFKNWVYELRS